MTPTQIVDFTRDNRKEFEDLLLDFVTKLRDEGKTTSYIEIHLTCVRSWLRFNDSILVRKINTGNTNLTPTIEDERFPTKTELKQIFTYVPERGKFSISFRAFNGVRPQVLGDITGSKGL